MNVKRAMRVDMQQRLRTLAKDYIDQQSAAVTASLLTLPSVSSSKALSIYLSMGGEVDTNSILRGAFAGGKRVFIPKIVGKKSPDMFMLEVSSMDMIDSFAKNSWGIPEPSLEYVQTQADGTYVGVIDCVVLPGVAFDRQCNRLGHGKGYYGKPFRLHQLFSLIYGATGSHTDSFIDRLSKANAEQGKAAPLLIGLALEEQIVESVPMEDHDRYAKS